MYDIEDHTDYMKTFNSIPGLIAKLTIDELTRVVIGSSENNFP
jgi:hypothetical protein